MNTPSYEPYETYNKLTEVVRAWAQSHPSVVRLRSLTQTHQGRDVWLLEIGREPDRVRPAIWIDAGMHSAELLGTSVALGIVSTLIELCERDEATPITDSCLFYVVPRVSPDGAEDVLATGRITRSAPPDRFRVQDSAHWVRGDLDGDGYVRQLRIVHPAGEFCAHPRYPDVLVTRELDDVGPFYRLFPEGCIESYDGLNIPRPTTLSAHDADFNRAFPYGWVGAADGAGPRPTADPETRAIVEFAETAPHIFLWLNLHTFGGVFIRPPFDRGPDLNRDDLAVYETLGNVIERRTGMQTVRASDELMPTDAPPLTGTLASWAYAERGCIAWAIELWNVFAAAEIPIKRPFYRNYTVGRADLEKLVEWDRRENSGRVFSRWKALQHPQLGSIEVGGIDPLWGLLNPPAHIVPSICQRMADLVATLTTILPRLLVEADSVRIDSEYSRIRLRIINTGWLPTYGTASSRARSWNASIRVTCSVEGCEVVAGKPVIDLPHLPGWGRQPEDEDNGPFFQRSKASPDVELQWVVRGGGMVAFEIGSPRLGLQQRLVRVLAA